VTAPALPANERPRSKRPPKPRRSPLVPLGLLGALVLTVWAYITVGIDVPGMIDSIGAGAGIVGEVLQINWDFFPRTVEPLIETIQIAIIATVIGCALALPLSFIASRVSTPNLWAMRIDRWVLNVIRALPDLLYAMVFVSALSIGPTAGILALILFNIGVMAKLLSETVDAVDTGPIEAAEATGSTHWQMVRVSVFPQVTPNYVSFGLYIFELNIRASFVIGLVGAGGIGQLLNNQMRFFNYGNVGLIIFEIFVIVLLIELASNALRRRLV
jgi:phosphonate transport system permease protein